MGWDLLGSNVRVTGALRCPTCLAEVKDFQEMERHHLDVHGVRIQDSPIPRWTMWKRLKRWWLDYLFVKEHYRKERERQNQFRLRR